MLNHVFVKKVWVTIALTALMTVFSLPAHAADIAAGAKVFSGNCAACHAGGRNAVNPMKTLKKEALEKYEMATAQAIVMQVTMGKNAMPAFGKKLKPEQIENVAAYVLAKADDGWAK